MTPQQFNELRDRLVALGYGKEIIWAESLMPCGDPERFLYEYVWVVLCSGLKEQVARRIESRVLAALLERGHITPHEFGHDGKRAAIENMFACYRHHYESYRASDDKLAYLRKLPFIGGITQYHLAKNLGMDVVKPDRHLVRIAEKFETTPGRALRQTRSRRRLP